MSWAMNYVLCLGGSGGPALSFPGASDQAFWLGVGCWELHRGVSWAISSPACAKLEKPPSLVRLFVCGLKSTHSPCAQVEPCDWFCSVDDQLCLLYFLPLLGCATSSCSQSRFLMERGLELHEVVGGAMN